jgi:hypothetical protein
LIQTPGISLTRFLNRKPILTFLPLLGGQVSRIPPARHFNADVFRLDDP